MSVSVQYNKDSVPVSAILASAFTDSAVKFELVNKNGPAELLNHNVTILTGSHNIARYFARSHPQNALYGSDPLSASQIDMWIDRAKTINESNLNESIFSLNAHLQLRTVVVGYHLTLADFAVYEAIRCSPKWIDELNSFQQGKTIPHVLRLFNYIESLPQTQRVQELLDSSQGKRKHKVALENVYEKKLDTGAQGSFEKIELPNAEIGKVVTRFPPEPSGYLHLGHIKAALLNNFYARAYKGTLILRFDDTNPAKEKDEYVESIISDLKTLNIKPDRTTYTSDYFDEIIKLAELLLRSGKGYIDLTPVQEMREQRGQGIESPYRNNSVEENLRLWGEMLKASPEGLKAVLRGKMNMQDANKVMRDASLFRCLNIPHHRTGNKYKAYPLYDFACPIVDSIEGVTHALRSSEYHDRNPLYNWVLEALNLRVPIINDFSRLNFTYVLLSKRKLQKFVDNGWVGGWDDPRFPTLQGVLRRGLTVEAIYEFILSLGASKSLNLMEMDKLWALNKKIIDPIAPRYIALAKQGLVTITLTNGPAQPEARSSLKHKENPSLGIKVLTYSNSLLVEGEDAKTLVEGEEITLIDWGNVIVKKLVKNGDQVTSVEAELHLAGDPKTTKKRLTWIGLTNNQADDTVTVVLREYDFLITKPKLEEDDELEPFVNKNSLFETETVGEPSLRLLNKGDKIQLLRRGYYICDQPVLPGKPLVLIMVPDGKVRQHSAVSAAHTSVAHQQKADTKSKQPKPTA
eukprot:TRINITY_DN4697_c0_g1_i1.p1 TRINITY_DN4697_c0_g1~~TRINITY_DN4697_c0_g1_i1.p1  ORF type:complete len:746 (-),score=182.79 TRINITY_DN4697_c0_g1_i1:94-2331(-)